MTKMRILKRAWSYNQRPARWHLQIGSRFFVIANLPKTLYWGARHRLAHHFAQKHAALGGCENCGGFWRLTDTPGMTAYAWDGQGEDPNRRRNFCEPCSEYYVECWEAQWAEYYSMCR